MASSGKEILIKAVAQAIPTYSMACFILPRGLCNHINTMIRRFYWGSRDGKRRTAWVSWDELTMPKYMGGLGFRDTELFNLAMLAKQGWRVLREPDSLCAKILKAVYFPSVDILDAELGSHPSQVWRAVHAGLSMLKQGLIRRIGDGETTSVWVHSWLPRDNMLCTLYPASNHLAEKVSELIDGPMRQWNQAAVNEHLCPMDAETIMNIPLSTVTHNCVFSLQGSTVVHYHETHLCLFTRCASREKSKKTKFTKPLGKTKQNPKSQKNPPKIKIKNTCRDEKTTFFLRCV